MATRAVLLGAFRLTVDGRPVSAAAFERPSGLRVLQLLLATPGHRIRREAAAELLWPEAEPERSSLNLRKALHFARRALVDAGLPAGIIGGTASVLELDPAAHIEIDVDRFRDAIDGVLDAAATARAVDPRALDVLASLGGDDLLPDQSDEEWLLPLRERLHRDTIEALFAGAAAARAMDRPELALRLVDRLLALEPAEEAAHQLAIELHIDAGRLAAARRQLVACAAALAEVYDVEPSPELRALIVQAPPRWAESEATGRGIGAILVDALVETITALAGEQPLALALADITGALRERPSREVAA